MKKLFFLLAAAAALVSCDQAQKPKVAGAKDVDMEAARKAVDASNEKFSRAATAGDSAAIVALYHSEPQVMPANMPSMSSAPAVGGFMMQLPKMGVKKLDLKTAELLPAGDYLIERGTYTMGDGAKDIDEGKYIVVWKQEGGQWKMYRDIWNSDNPPPPPPTK